MTCLNTIIKFLYYHFAQFRYRAILINCFMNFESKSQYLQVAKWREKMESALFPRDFSITVIIYIRCHSYILNYKH